MGSNEGGGCDGKQVVVVPEIKYTKLFINGEFVDIGYVVVIIIGLCMHKAKRKDYTGYAPV